MSIQVQLRRDTAANWASTNPTLAQGEIGIDLTNNISKIGDGSTAWNSLKTGNYLIGCRVHANAGTSLTSSWNTVAFGAEDFDTDDMHDNSTNNSRITVNHAGTYIIGGSVAIAANAVTGVKIMWHHGSSDDTLASQKQGNSGSIEYASISTVCQASVGDYFYLQGYAGSTQNNTGDAANMFWAIKVD